MIQKTIPASAATESLRALIVEDCPEDAELAVRQLEQDGYVVSWERVDTEAAYCRALQSDLDVVLADFNLPSFSAVSALDVLRALRLDVPLIVVSGSIGEDTAVQMLQAGAADYLLKDRLARLGPAVRRATTDRRLRVESTRAQDALRASEERTRFALDAARVGVWETDLATSALHWSEIVEAQHGLAPGTFGQTRAAFLECVHPDDRARLQTTMSEAAVIKTDTNVLYRAVWPDGTVRWINAIGRTTRDATGRALRAGITIDVTERRLLEEQYRQAQKMEAVGQLAGGIAHDFNNLLTVILGYCALLRDALGSDNTSQAEVSEIRAAAESAATLTRQLLAFSRRQILEVQALDVREIVRNTEMMLRRLIGEQIGLVVRADAPAGRIKADAGQIQQVILNLALNARDAMPDGGTLEVEIASVTLESSDRNLSPEVAPGRYVMLTVRDSGVGMDAATRARIFEPFFTTKRLGRGTGLGLSTVYGIAQQSQGGISVASEPGKGSAFSVYFPEIPAPPDSPRRLPGAPDLAGTETILVVEDEPALRELLLRTLQRYGYRVAAAATPTEALEIAGSLDSALDVLVSDVGLPEMNGRALADLITRRHPETRVIFTSGYADDEAVRGAIQQGKPFLQKPFAPEAVARKVREVLDGGDQSPACPKESHGPNASAHPAC